MSIPHHSTNLTPLQKLLASRATRSEAATALGITPSAVTQLAEQLPQDQESLKRSTAIDEHYDTIEAKLLTQLERTIPMLLRPAEIARTLQIVNGAKRRGVGAIREQGPTHIIALNLPLAIQNKFTVNSSNQVVSAGTQDLVTMPSAAVPRLLESHNATTKKLSTNAKDLGFD